jgi:hypothetical protein
LAAILSTQVCLQVKIWSRSLTIQL